ncbi:MAG: preprotein translocase subunit SecG [Betaproteobacteria bacterium]|nr:preprotein translocase subunit SecG [Betaproteobacteria bacterium]
MNIWLTLVLIVHVVAALAIIGLVLLQHGKGADVGAAFGSGASGSLFGATGSANFLSRATGVLAAIFFLTSLGLAYLASHRTVEGAGVMDAVKEAPVSPVPSPTSAPVPSVDKPAAESGASKDSKANEVPK